MLPALMDDSYPQLVERKFISDMLGLDRTKITKKERKR
jgi:hypothetical protein